MRSLHLYMHASCGYRMIIVVIDVLQITLEMSIERQLSITSGLHEDVYWETTTHYKYGYQLNCSCARVCKCYTVYVWSVRKGYVTLPSPPRIGWTRPRGEKDHICVHCLWVYVLALYIRRVISRIWLLVIIILIAIEITVVLALARRGVGVGRASGSSGIGSGRGVGTVFTGCAEGISIIVRLILRDLDD